MPSAPSISWGTALADHWRNVMRGLKLVEPVPAICGMALLGMCGERSIDDPTDGNHRQGMQEDDVTQRDAERMAEDERSNAIRARAAYAVEVKHTLKQLDDDIEDLRALGGTGGMHDALSRIDQARRSVGNEIEQLELSPVTDWHAQHQRIETMLDDLRAEVKDAQRAAQTDRM